MSEAEAWEQVLPWSLRALVLWPPGARAADGGLPGRVSRA